MKELFKRPRVMEFGTEVWVPDTSSRFKFDKSWRPDPVTVLLTVALGIKIVQAIRK